MSDDAHSKLEEGYGANTSQIDLTITQEQQNNDRAYFGVQKKTSAMCCSIREIILLIGATVLLTLVVGAFTGIGISSLVINAKCPQYKYKNAYTIVGGHGDTIEQEYSLDNITDLIIQGDIRSRFYVDATLVDTFRVKVIRRSWSDHGYKGVKQSVSNYNVLNSNRTITSSQLIYKTRMPKSDFTDCVHVLQEIYLPANLTNYKVTIRSYAKDVDFYAPDDRFVMGGLTISGGNNLLQLNNVTVMGVLIFTMTRGAVEFENVGAIATVGAVTEGRFNAHNYASYLTTIKTQKAKININRMDCRGGNLTTESTTGSQTFKTIVNAQSISAVAKSSGAIYMSLSDFEFFGRFSFKAGSSFKTTGESLLIAPTKSTNKIYQGYIGEDDPTRTINVQSKGNIRLYLNPQ